MAPEIQKHAGPGGNDPIEAAENRRPGAHDLAKNPDLLRQRLPGEISLQRRSIALINRD
jgi:hypothetical protein